MYHACVCVWCVRACMCVCVHRCVSILCSILFIYFYCFGNVYNHVFLLFIIYVRGLLLYKLFKLPF